VELIEEFVAFMGAYEIKSLFEKYEDCDAAIYRSENYAILKCCHENYEYDAYIDEFIEKVSAVQEETNILQAPMEEEIDDTMSSLDEKDDEESEEQKECLWDDSMVDAVGKQKLLRPVLEFYFFAGVSKPSEFFTQY
jgi:hypothetical protein